MRKLSVWVWLCCLGTQLWADDVLLGSLLKARYAMVVGDYDKALVIAKGARDTAPTSADAAYLECEIMLSLIKNRGVPSPEFEQDLLQKLQLGLQKFPKDYRFYMTLGRVLTASYRWKRFSRFEDPAVYLREAIRLKEQQAEPVDRDLVETYYQLGLWYFSKDKPFLAAEYLKVVCQMDPSMAWAFYYAGQACEKSGQYYSALSILENYKALGLRDISSTKRPLHLTNATLRTILEPNEEHLEALFKAIAEEGGRASTYADVALRLYRVEDFQSSLSVLQKLETDQKTLTTLNLELRILMELHEYARVAQKSIDLLEQEKDPRKRRLLVDYGAEAAFLARDEGTLKGFTENYSDVRGTEFRLGIFAAFDEVLRTNTTKTWDQLLATDTNPDFVQYLNEEARAKGVRVTVLENVTQFYQARRDWLGAMALLTAESTASDPDSHLWDDLADGHALAERWEQAFGWYDRILKKEPNRADILNNYGYFLTLRNQDLDFAKTLVNKAVVLEPNTSAYLDSRAWVHFKTGDLLTAESDLLRALAIEPNDPEKLDHYGDVQWALGNQRGAREAWSKALTLLQEDTYHLGRERILGMVKKLDAPESTNIEVTP